MTNAAKASSEWNAADDDENQTTGIKKNFLKAASRFEKYSKFAAKKVFNVFRPKHRNTENVKTETLTL